MGGWATGRAVSVAAGIGSAVLIAGSTWATATGAQATSIAASAASASAKIAPRSPAPRVVPIKVPEAAVRVYVREAGQTSLGTGRAQGLRIGSPTGSAGNSDLLVYSGGGPEREFCVDIVRINNLFGLSFVFATASMGDIYRVRFRSAAWADQLPLASGEVSVRVRASSKGRCTGPLLVAGWEVPGEPAVVWVPYNGGQASTARLQVGAQPADVCTPVKDILAADVQAVQFNFICRLPLPVTVCDRPTSVQIQRDIGARSDPTIDRLDARLPCLVVRP